MSQVSVVPSADPHGPSSTRIGETAPLTLIDDVRCALCGTSLVGLRARYRVVSPFVSMGRVTVCWICRRATLSEGYRPAN
jgi:hypothetical protein